MRNNHNSLLAEPSELEHLYRVAPVGLCLTDRDHRYVRINQKLADINGKSVAEHLGRTIKEVIPDIATQIVSMFQRVIDSGEPILDNEVRGSTAAKPGEIRIFLGDHYPLKSEDGQVRYVSTIVRDITDRKMAEEALRKAHKELERRIDERTSQLRLLLETTRAIPWEADARTWMFTYVGPQAEKLLGYPINKWYEKDFWIQHIHPDDRDSTVTFCLESSHRCKDYEFEYRMISADGREVWLHDMVSVVSSNGEPQALRGFMIDVTERKRAEIEVRQHRAELAHIGRVSTMGELAAAIAHELNQPLAAIAANVGAAKRFMKSGKVDLKEIGDILEDIAEDDKRAAEVILRLRSLMKKGEINIEALEVNEMIRETLVLVHSDLLIKSVGIEADLGRDLPTVQGDRVQVQQVFLNLVMNARDAVKELEHGRQRIIVRTKSSGKQGVQVAVSDYGNGIVEENLEKIFHPFFSTKPQGLGMGLAISRTIIEAHGGRLWVENNPDQGATFYFTLRALEA